MLPWDISNDVLFATKMQVFACRAKSSYRSTPSKTPRAVQSWMIRHGSMRAKPTELSLDSASTSVSVVWAGLGFMMLEINGIELYVKKHQFITSKILAILDGKNHLCKDPPNEVFAIQSCRIHVLFAHLMSPTLSWHPPKRKLTIKKTWVWTSYSMFAVPKGSPKSSLKKRENILHYSGEPKIRVHMQLASFT